MKRMFLRLTLINLVILALLSLSSCAHQPTPMAYDPPGFFSGLLHGALMFFSFIGSLFMDVRIYSFPNSGVWYDFGFLIGAGAAFGGAGSAA